jgi:SM-20-related protein
MKAALEPMRTAVMAGNERVRAVLDSTSWKATAPLRWVGRRVQGAPRSHIIRLDRIELEALEPAPYEWAFVNGLFSRRAGQMLVRSYPCDNFKTVKGYDGEKGYEYEARALVHMNAAAPAFPEGLSKSWRMLARDLLSPAYRTAMTRLIGRDLSHAAMEAYVCHYGPGAWLGPHVDLKEKIVTHVFYFNATWNREDGGCLNILRSPDMADKCAEITPIVGNSSVLVRSEDSWHSVSRVANGCRSSRRSMNVIFYHPGAVSTMWPPGDDTPLHDYREASV